MAAEFSTSMRATTLPPVRSEAEVLLRPGSVVVQRGTNHAWANRSGRPCRMLFVLVDGQYDAGIARGLAGRAAHAAGAA